MAKSKGDSHSAFVADASRPVGDAREGIARMRTLFAATIAATVLFNGAAMAQDSADALKTFGLIGIWSPDCTRNPEDALPGKPLSNYPVRWIYSIDNAEPKLTRMIHGLSTIETRTYDIKSAKVIGPTKLKYSQVPATVQLSPASGAQSAQPAKESPSDVIVELSDDKLRVFSQIAADGAVDVEHGFSIIGHGWDSVRLKNPWFDRCSN
jgi:hypothetical protein